ncbi:MAG: DUF58 domain-containing protein [Gammaproteobacteria bacterium]|nr:DUF58 domain-containing protein [Gammaproteobacteria bacterium]
MTIRPKPSRRLIQWLGIAVVLAFALACYRFYASWQDQAIDDQLLVWLLYGLLAFIGLAALIDLLNKSHLSQLSAKRKLPNNIASGALSHIKVMVSNQSERTVSLQVYDHFPELVDAAVEAHQLNLEPQQEGELQYAVRAHTRGDAIFGDVQLIVESPFKLWQWSINLPQNDVIKIYPNFTQISHFNMLAGEHNLADMGIHLKQLRGQGMEFHQLRDYRKGDSLRQIDWGATSRRQKLISREYQEEKDQQIIFLIDCGKRMRTKDDHLSHFDHTLNALLLLAYVALKQEDAVGFQTFGGQTADGKDRGILPIKGQQQINLLLNQLYDVHPTLTASDYLLAAQDLISKTKKRALVVLVSNMRDDDLPELAPAIKLLQKHHLVLLANLREAVFDKILDEPIDDFNQAALHAETELFLEKRQGLLDYFMAKGVVTVDSTPQQLPAHLVNQYLNIKRSGRL